ncbi:MAG TPA: hypothetical protein VD757_00795, partial [Candidatus Nitrosocosmicus sp.]|nr:hypothetical protein [Candidatus Nitrosocosmicus sp.]
MTGVLMVYILINLALGAALFILRDSAAYAAALIVLMLASGAAVIVRLTSISGRIGNNIEVITRGQLNQNVRKTGIKMFDFLSSRVNDFLLKIRGLIASFGDVSKRVMKDAHEV